MSAEGQMGEHPGAFAASGQQASGSGTLDSAHKRRAERPGWVWPPALISETWGCPAALASGGAEPAYPARLQGPGVRVTGRLGVSLQLLPIRPELRPAGAGHRAVSPCSLSLGCGGRL